MRGLNIEMSSQLVNAIWLYNVIIKWRGYGTTFLVNLHVTVRITTDAAIMRYTQGERRLRYTPPQKHS